MNAYTQGLQVSGNRNKGKGNGTGLARESHSHCVADEFGIPYTHFFGTDTQHDQSRKQNNVVNYN